MEDIIIKIGCVDEAAEEVIEVVVCSDDADDEPEVNLGCNAPNRFGQNSKVGVVI